MLTSSHSGVTFQGLGMPSMPTLVGPIGGNATLMGLGSGASTALGVGAAAVVIGAAVNFGLYWWAFSASRDGSNWKPAAILVAPALLMGIVFGGAALASD